MKTIYNICFSVEHDEGEEISAEKMLASLQTRAYNLKLEEVLEAVSHDEDEKAEVYNRGIETAIQLANECVGRLDEGLTLICGLHSSKKMTTEDLKREEALTKLTQQAQELDMGYGD